LLRQANVDEASIEQMLGVNAARQFDIELVRHALNDDGYEPVNDG